MAQPNREKVDRALHILSDALGAFVEREMDAAEGSSWRKWIDAEFDRRLERRLDGSIEWEIQPLLRVMIKSWNEVFKKTLGHAERSYVGEITDVRNRWAHQKVFSYEDTHRALDSIERLLIAISAGRQAAEINAMRQEVLRTMFAEQRRVVERRQTVLTLDQAPKTGLLPWREVITPRKDVATGNYAVAEFAADLAQVRRGDAGKEYGDPAEFFRRTYLTGGLSRLLEGAMRRLSGKGGDPVVELQTNFGGGKTHSMLALYHMAGHGSPASLTGLDQLMTAAGIASVPKAERAVFVGTSFSPGQRVRREDGVATQTIWGHIAYELAGAMGYQLVAEFDRRGLAPGSDVLVELLKLTAPCLILIDEWVAFVRQLYGKTDTPAGSFETNLTFAQNLSEAVKAVPGAVLVASLPASDIEIGGDGGQQALAMLKNTFGRIEASWRPATAQEGFEIVRRRLFEPITAKELFVARDAVVKAFVDAYRESGAMFPSEVSEDKGGYKALLDSAYPIHPELFAQLTDAWGSLDKFQKTRGVLRLMASVVNVLWEQGDKSLMIMPGSVPLDDHGVITKLLDYLPQPWDAIVSGDIDGEHCRALRIDKANPNLQRYGATRRMARSIFMATAPYAGGRNPGIDDRRARLGAAQPGETPGVFGDALRRLADDAMHLYVDGNRYWFDTQPTVARLANERARDFPPEVVWGALSERLGRARAERKPFTGVHVAPGGSGDVPDEQDARLVILGPRCPHQQQSKDSEAIRAAREILDRRGVSPRIYRNALLFLAPDHRQLAQLDEALRGWMAWCSIVKDKQTLQLTPFQEQQAHGRAQEGERIVDARIRETWVWAMAPYQAQPTRPDIDWQIGRVSGDEPLPARAAKRFQSDEALLTQLGARSLRQELDRHELWRGNDHVGVKQVRDDFASYLHLSRRLPNREVLADAIRTGISQLVCDQIAYAEAYEPARKRYASLHATSAGMVQILFDDNAVIVKAEAANAQIAADKHLTEKPSSSSVDQPGTTTPTPPTTPIIGLVPRRFYASVDLSPDRIVRDGGAIAREIVEHLVRNAGWKVSVRLEIDAESDAGFSDDVRQIVEENCATLKIRKSGFEAQ